MTDQKTKALQELVDATEKLLKDMRQRAISRGDYEEEELPIEGGMGAKNIKKIATLDCGNSVLYAIHDAIRQAKEELKND